MANDDLIQCALNIECLSVYVNPQRCSADLLAVVIIADRFVVSVRNFDGEFLCKMLKHFGVLEAAGKY